MLVIPLQSGSKGNCYYVESESTKLLFDAGISFRQAQRRLESRGRDIQEVDALFITHDHTDHSRYAGDFGNRLDIPVYSTSRTHQAINNNSRIKSISHAICFSAGEELCVGNCRISSIPTPHDAVDGVAFVVESLGQRIGILTDLGYAFAGLKQVLQSLDAVIIESNYDPELLDISPYPDFLKNRIRGNGGHLSNEEAAKLIFENQSDKMQWVCLCHLSDENNCPDTAIRTHQQWLGEDFPIYVADRHRVSQTLKLAQAMDQQI